MPVANIFDRTALFYREKADNGRTRIRRIPWDLIYAPGSKGLFVSPMPVSLNSLSEVTTSTVINDNVMDMLYEDADVGQIDDVVDILWFQSEADFISKFEGVFGFYNGNETQSAEFGYPRAS